MRWRWLLGLLVALGWGQSSCPYVRYIQFDACGDGEQEGLNEYLFIWSGPGFNIDQLAISFPVRPSSNQLDCDNPTNWICNNNCGTGWICPASLVSSLNSTACTGTTFQCISNGQDIPANAWVLIFTGNAPTYIPSASNLCGAGTIYVAVANQNSGVGRYLNNPSSSQNRRTRIAFSGMPACSMTVNYQDIPSPSVNGRSLIIEPQVCIGQTAGANESPSCSNVGYEPPDNACYYGRIDAPTSNGVSLYTPSNNTCPLPPLNVLPILWAYTHIEGTALVWHATGVGGDEEARLTLWHSATAGGEWRVEATGLPLVGRYPLSVSGFYRLSAPLRDGSIAYSPVVEYRMETQPALYPNPAPGGPYLSAPEHVLYAEVINLTGERVLSLSAPLGAESLRGLPPGAYLVRLLTAAGERSFRVVVP